MDLLDYMKDCGVDKALCVYCMYRNICPQIAEEIYYSNNISEYVEGEYSCHTHTR